MTYFSILHNITYIHTYLYNVECIWQGLNISENICPDASTKFWHFAGVTTYFFKNTMRKLRSRAFQRCITISSQNWTVWPWEAVFCKKLPQKQLFFSWGWDTNLDTQIDLIQGLSFAQNWLNSMFNSKNVSWKFNSINYSIQFNKLFNWIFLIKFN